MPVRRCADPASVQHVWDAIRVANHQRQMADSPRIVKYLQKVFDCTQNQAELYLKQSARDGLVISQQKTVAKGFCVGALVECYKIPLEELKIPQDDGKDWYCIECHLAGDVTACKCCFRVFHTECSKNARRKLDVFKTKANKITDYTTAPVADEVEKELAKFEGLNNNVNNSGENSEVELVDESAKVNSKPEAKFVSFESYLYDEGLCSICNLAKVDIDCGVAKDELNHLLTFVLTRICTWLPENLTKSMAPETSPEWLTEQERNWRAQHLFYQHIDMPLMQLKLRCSEYNQLSEFYADVITIQHNVAIYHGIESQEYAAAELMIQDCLHDLNEFRNCVDCYKHSNEKVHEKWFCIPCRIPHTLVWAKQKGYPYWPAKVIRETETQYDVRYFGSKNERSLLPKNCVKPIATSMNALQIKKSPAFRKAYDELLLHQKLIADPNELVKLLMTKRRKRKRHSAPAVVEKVAVADKSADEFRDLSVENEDSKGKRKGSEDSESSSSTFKKTRVTRSQQQILNTSEPLVGSAPSKNGPNDVIDISDGEENEYVFPTDEYQFAGNFDGARDQVSSSTEYFRTPDNFNSANSENSLHQLDQPYCDSVEKMRRKLETAVDKNQLIKLAMDCMQAEVDKITNDHNEHLKKLFESHNAQISETKKKQWCYNCEQDAIYHCCWNTAYCSPTCQQQHWQAEHKKVCRRKR